MQQEIQDILLRIYRIELDVMRTVVHLIRIFIIKSSNTEPEQHN